MSLFSDTYEDSSSLEKISFAGGDLLFMNNFLPQVTALELYQSLKAKIAWRQEEVFVYGKKHLVPRLTAWYGEKEYSYSRLLHQPKSWNDELIFIKEELKKVLPHFNPNGVLLNYYRNGKDKMGWHSDDEKELGVIPMIVSISLGATRRFDLKHSKDKNQKMSIHLNTGSLLIMSGESQMNWLHQIPQQLKVEGGRINLTFRELI